MNAVDEQDESQPGTNRAEPELVDENTALNARVEALRIAVREHLAAMRR